MRGSSAVPRGSSQLAHWSMRRKMQRRWQGQAAIGANASSFGNSFFPPLLDCRFLVFAQASIWFELEHSRKCRCQLHDSDQRRKFNDFSSCIVLTQSRKYIVRNFSAAVHKRLDEFKSSALFII